MSPALLIPVSESQKCNDKKGFCPALVGGDIIFLKVWIVKMCILSVSAYWTVKVGLKSSCKKANIGFGPSCLGIGDGSRLWVGLYQIS